MNRKSRRPFRANITFDNSIRTHYKSAVARITRAWIETVLNAYQLPVSEVARITRAWIETRTTDALTEANKSPASRGRGLKPIFSEESETLDVARITRAWIETYRECGFC